MLLAFILILEGSAAIASLYFGTKYKYNVNSFYLFQLYLILTFITEIVGFWGTSISSEWNNLIWYNPMLFIRGLLIILFLSSQQIFKIPIKTTLFFLASYIGLTLVEAVFLKRIDQEYFTLSNSYLIIVISIYSMKYIWNIIRSDRIFVLHRDLLFWICGSLLIFNLSSLPITLLSNDLDNYLNPASINRSLLIINFLCIFMYSSFIIGMVCAQKTKKYFG